MKSAPAARIFHEAEESTVRTYEKVLYREARLLDEESWDEWLALMTDDIHYWMPAVENRRRSDRLGAWEPGRGAYFDDNHRDLSIRVSRFKQPSAWAEDPPTRHVHVVTNIEVFVGDLADETIVLSNFVNYRSRGEADNDLLLGRREDVWRMVNGSPRLARRKVLITQSLLMSKNLNTFF